MTVDDLSLVLMHQANKRINEYCQKALGLPDEKVIAQHPEVREHDRRHHPPALGRARRAAGRIRPGDLVLLVAFGAGMSWGATLAAGLMRRLRRHAFFLLPLLFLLGLGLRYIRSVPATGDEVEYLLLAQSLWREHDLDLRDNFARGDHLEYSHDLTEMPYGTWRADGRPISTTAWDCPSSWRRLRARWPSRVRRSHGAVRRCARGPRAPAGTEVLRRRRRRLLAWLVAAGPPVFFYGFHVYTEVPSALLALLAFVLLLRSQRVGVALIAGAAVGFLPWLHVKMIPAALVLGLMGLVRLRGPGRVAFLAVVAVFAAGYGFHHYSVFGDPSPLFSTGRRCLEEVQRSSPWLSLPGLLLDGAFGLLPLAPGVRARSRGSWFVWAAPG